MEEMNEVMVNEEVMPVDEEVDVPEIVENNGTEGLVIGGLVLGGAIIGTTIYEVGKKYVIPFAKKAFGKVKAKFSKDKKEEENPLDEYELVDETEEDSNEEKQ